MQPGGLEEAVRGSKRGSERRTASGSKRGSESLGVTVRVWEWQ
jgi:hypothetical protein